MVAGSKAADVPLRLPKAHCSVEGGGPVVCCVGWVVAWRLVVADSGIPWEWARDVVVVVCGMPVSYQNLTPAKASGW